MRQAYQIHPRPLLRLCKPVRDAKYKRWVKRFACAACGSCRLVDPAHTGMHGLGSKSSDFSVIPLCRACHEAFDADPFNLRVSNTLKVLEVLDGYETLETDHFLIRFDPQKDKVFARYLQLIGETLARPARLRPPVRKGLAFAGPLLTPLRRWGWA